MKSIAKLEAIKLGWEAFKKQPWLLIGITIAVWVIPQLVQSGVQLPFGLNPLQMNETPEVNPTALLGITLSIIVSVLVSIYLSIGVVHVSLKLASGKKVVFGDLFEVKARQFVMFLLAGILSLLILLPLILLLVFGLAAIPTENNSFIQPLLLLAFFFILLVIAIKFQFYSYRIVDKDVNALDALKDSFRMTNGYEFHLFLFILLIIGVSILGLLALVVGILVATPVTWVAQAHVYQKLSKAAKK